MRRILFVCGKNRLRSPTAEAIFSGREGLEVSSAGTAADAECRVSGDLIDWADEIFAMESRYGRQIRKQFGPLLRDKRLVVLDVPDRFTYMQPELIEILETKMAAHLA